MKLAAGWLIEQAGLKGTCCGDIRVYEKQALVLVHQGNSRGAELEQLVRLIQGKIWQQFAVRLEHEVRLIAAQGECHINLIANMKAPDDKKQAILVALNNGQFVSGQALREQLGVSRAAIAKHIAVATDGGGYLSG